MSYFALDCSTIKTYSQNKPGRLNKLLFLMYGKNIDIDYLSHRQNTNKISLMKFLLKLFIFIGIVFLTMHYLFGVSFDDLRALKELPSKSVCDNQITYKIGTIDPKFNLSEEYFSEKIEEAAEIWESAYGKKIFVYDPESNLDINLIYDERQENLNVIQKNEPTILNETASLEEQNKIYEQKVAELEQQIEDLNNQIDYWNSKGGAPEAEFKYLTKMQEDLNKKVEELNDYADNLNRVVNEVNKNIDNFNQMVSKFNNIVMEKPEIGLYTSGEEKIDVYFFSDEDNLVDTLAHELGHSLGLDHIEAEGAIMNPVVSDETELTDVDINLITNYCSEHTYINDFKVKIKYYFNLIGSNLKNFLVTPN